MSESKAEVSIDCSWNDGSSGRIEEGVVGVPNDVEQGEGRDGVKAMPSVVGGVGV